MAIAIANLFYFRGMNTSVTIRRAVREDCAAMLELVHELALFEKAPHEVTISLEHFTDSGFGEKPVWWAFVAEENGVVLGFALYYIRFSTWKGQRLYLEDFIVTEKARGRGIGKALFEIIIQEGKEKGFTGMMLQVLDWNEPAIKFYKKYEMKLDPEWMNASLDF